VFSGNGRYAASLRPRYNRFATNEPHGRYDRIYRRIATLPGTESERLGRYSWTLRPEFS
jgi:hypothetical protein